MGGILKNFTMGVLTINIAAHTPRIISQDWINSVREPGWASLNSFMGLLRVFKGFTEKDKGSGILRIGDLAALQSAVGLLYWLSPMIQDLLHGDRHGPPRQ